MSTFNSQVTYLPGVVAAADYTAASNQYKLVKLSAAGTVTVCAATTDEPIGVLVNRPASGEAADVVIAGLCKVRAGDAVSVGERIAPDADGDGIGSSTSDHYIIGKAVTATTDASGGGYFTAIISSPAQIID